MGKILAVRSPSPDVGRCEYFELECREAYFTYVSFVILHASINVFVHFVVNSDVLMSDQNILQINIVLNSVCQHNYFITQGNYIGYMFRL